MRNFALFFSCVLVLLVSACEAGSVVDQAANVGDASSGDSVAAAKFGQRLPALTMQLDNAGVYQPQACNPNGDPDCNAVGPGQRQMCDPDSLCRLYWADDDLIYKDNSIDPTAVSTFPWVSCGVDDDCLNNMPVAYAGKNLVSKCLHTQSAEQTTLGVCLYSYASCQSMKDTPCAVTGYNLCTNGVCACSAVANLAKATTETCDSVDNNCDGATDETFSIGKPCDGADSDVCLNGTFTCKPDQLGNQCTNETVSNITELCNGLDDDCDGAIDEDFPTLGNACDGEDNDMCANGKFVCNGTDFKGVVCGAESMSNVEICNAKDDTCDGKVDEGFTYLDMGVPVPVGGSCGVGACMGGVVICANVAQTTCSTGVKATPEVCDSIDNDCDGVVDNGVLLTFYKDADGDKFGDKTKTKMQCAASPTWVADNTDCDDTKAAVNPFATEMCNGIDDNCDLAVDEGFTYLNLALAAQCGVGECAGGMVVCAADNKSATCSTLSKIVPEVCDSKDNDCNGAIDDGGVLKTFYKDADSDTYGDATDSKQACVAPATYVADKTDCNDALASTNPGAQDVCNQVDDNCDGKLDIAADGSAACDVICPISKAINPGIYTPVDMNSFAANNISSYQCGAAAKADPTNFSGKEAVLVPNCPKGNTFSVQTNTTGVRLYRLKGSCAPTSGVSVDPTVCVAFANTSLSGGTVGKDYIVVDSTTNKVVNIKFTCTPPT